MLGHVRLTRDVQSQDGWIWSKTPINQKNFAMEFKFNVNHDGSFSGDGFAFWIAKETKQSGFLDPNSGTLCIIKRPCVWKQGLFQRLGNLFRHVRQF